MLATWITMSPATAQVSEGSGWMSALKEKIRTTEFEFSRADSDVPFLPVASIGVAAYGKSEFERFDGSGEKVEFRSINTGAYGSLPLYIGRRDLVAAVPYVSHTEFSSLTAGVSDRSVVSFYLPLAWLWQSENKLQWGSFIMPSMHSPFDTEGDWGTDFMGGVLGRCFSGDRAVWYYGIIYDYSFGGDFFYPYLGYSYQIDRNWLISLVLPWPTVTYAPSKEFVLQAGFLPSGATWVMDGSGKDTQVAGSLGGWDLGVTAGRRLKRNIWFDAGAGLSGLRSLRFNESGELQFEQNLGREPYVSVALSIRPE